MFGLKDQMLFGAYGERRRWREIVAELVRRGDVKPGDYARALAEGPGPAHWAFALFVFFGAAQLIAALVYFFAFNWRELPDMAKIALPQTALLLGLGGWLAFRPDSVLSRVSAALTAMMIGVSMGVVGQVYQLGADPWRLFSVWAAFVLPMSLLARSDALYVIFAAVAAAAWNLYAFEELSSALGEARLTIPAVTAIGLAALLLAREAAGPAPRWLRWLFAAVALLLVAPPAISETFGGGKSFFSDGVVATAALALIVMVFLSAYAFWKPDRPVRAMCLFAVAVWIGAFGLRTIWRADFDSAGAAAFGFIVSALWVVAVTAALAFVFRRLTGEGATS